MALKLIRKDTVPTYICLSTDISGTTLTGVGILGATVLATDTGDWYIVTASNTLATYATPSTITASDIEIGAVEIKNSSSDVRATVGANGLHVDVQASSGVGSLTETAPTTDTASSGLNGRLQRVAQRLSSLIGLLPLALGANGGLKIEGIAAGEAVPVVGLSTTVTQTILINTAIATAGFDMSNYIGGMVITPTAWTAANIGFYVCDTLAGTYVIAKDKYGIPLQITTVATGADGAYAIPTEIFTAKFVKIWSKNTTAATETDINQAAERTVKVMLK